MRMRSGHGLAVLLVAVPTCAFAACSAAYGPYENPGDGGAGGADAARGSDGMTAMDALAPGQVPQRLFFVHVADLTASGIADIRVCPAPDDAGARPWTTRVPRTSYTGVARGGVAEIEGAGGYSSALAIDAFGLADIEGTPPFSCAKIANNVSLNKLTLPAATPQLPGVAVLRGATGDGGALGLVTLRASQVAMPPAVQIGLASASLASAAVEIGFGPLDGQCPATRVYEGPLAVGDVAPPAPRTFTPPTSGFDTAGLKVCVAGDGGAPALVLSRSYAELQSDSAPASVPGDFWGARALYLVVLAGETGATAPELAPHALVVPFRLDQ